MNGLRKQCLETCQDMLHAGRLRSGVLSLAGMNACLQVCCCFWVSDWVMSLPGCVLYVAVCISDT